ncbi:MAG: aminomethyltransferase family protein [Candidatus Latescibacterota bacterium]|nr:MAG: aminomethyltransferase family protein [Candidatus Latescibacterota bacterium]
MPVPTPFHSRTSECCTSLLYKDWAGYYAVRSYDTYPEREYFAIRHAAGLIDVTPLFKCEVYGAGAAAFLSQIMVRNIAKLKVGQVAYCCWCDGRGKVIDDGTVARIDDTYFRVTSNWPSVAWLSRFSRGVEVTIEDSTHNIGALAIQGPYSREVAKIVSDIDVGELGFFWTTPSRIDGVDVHISRTGYTGDLGYEIWVDKKYAVKVWDAVMSAGKGYGLLPAGLDAMDITRIEAGYLLNGVDYYNANHCIIESRKSTPYELGFGWMVKLKRGSFVGRDALVVEKSRGPQRLLVGLHIDWDEHAALFAEHGLPPEIASAAWRTSIPVYGESGEQIGYANSGTWSPILKKNLALATVKAPFGKEGSKLRFEVTVEYERRTVTATVVKKPFFDPERKRA